MRSDRPAAVRAIRSKRKRGYFNNGLGARVSANWRSGTRVDSSNGRRSAFLAARHVRSQAFRQSRRAIRPRFEASLASRFVRAARGEQSLRFEAAGPQFGWRRSGRAISRTCSTRSDGRSSVSIRKLFLPPTKLLQAAGGPIAGLIGINPPMRRLDQRSGKPDLIRLRSMDATPSEFASGRATGRDDALLACPTGRPTLPSAVRANAT